MSAWRNRSTLARPSRWLRWLSISLVGVAACGAWVAYALSTIDLRYEAAGSLVLAGPSLGMSLDPGNDNAAPEAPTGDVSDLASELSRLARRDSGGASVAIEPISPDLLHVRVEARSNGVAQRQLDATLSSATRDSGDAIVIFRSSDLASSPGYHRAGALLGISAPSSRWSARWVPPAPYLLRVAGVQLESDAKFRHDLGQDAEVRVTQMPQDSAHVIELAVVGAEPAGTTEAYAVAVARLQDRIGDLQDVHAVPPAAQLRLIPLNRPGTPTLVTAPLLTPFFHLSSMLLVLMTLAGFGLERLARRPHEGRR